MVTGISGCIGQALYKNISDDVEELVVLGRSLPPMTTASADDQKKIAIHEVDLTESLDIKKLPNDVDCVVHLAQSRNHRNFPEAASEMFSINTARTHELVEYALKYSGAKSFVYASTGSVYSPSSKPVKETSETAPNTFYSASKLAAENLLEPYRKEMNVSILRFFYVYGPGQVGMLTTNLANRIRHEQPITLMGENGLLLTPTYSDDAAKAIRSAILGQWNETVNVGSPYEISIKDFSIKIGKAIRMQPKFEVFENTTQASLLPNIEKLRSLISKQYQFTNVDVGLQKMFNAC